MSPDAVVPDEPPCIVCGGYCGQCGGTKGNDTEIRADANGSLWRWRMKKVNGVWTPVRSERLK